MDPNDHDLLVRIDEQLKQLKIGIETERVSVNARAAEQKLDIEKLRSDVDGLRTSRAQFYAVAATMSFIIGLVIRFFWK